MIKDDNYINSMHAWFKIQDILIQNSIEEIKECERQIAFSFKHIELIKEKLNFDIAQKEKSIIGFEKYMEEVV